MKDKIQAIVYFNSIKGDFDDVWPDRRSSDDYISLVFRPDKFPLPMSALVPVAEIKQPYYRPDNDTIWNFMQNGCPPLESLDLDSWADDQEVEIEVKRTSGDFRIHRLISANKCRSMDCGDVILDNEAWWMCGTTGWQKFRQEGMFLVPVQGVE